MNLDNIPFPELLEDLQDFCKNEDARLLGEKALRVQVKCRIRGHYELADRIANKYRRQQPKFDFIVANQMALQAMDLIKEKKNETT